MADPPGAEPGGYRIFRSLARFLAGLFYQRVEVAGLERYTKDLDLAGLTDRDLSEGYRPAAVLRYAFREGLALALGLPLALWGVVNHVPEPVLEKTAR